MKLKGNLFVISGPSGAGKGTLLNQVVANNKKIKYSVSATTRLPRACETDGVNYFFLCRDKFEKMIANNELIEWVEYCGNYYGTPKDYVESNMNDGNDIILEIETHGAMKIKESFPDSLLIFIAPPSFEELKRRLINRGTETTEIIEKRISKAKDELNLINEYDYIIINDKINDAAKNLKTVIEAQRFRIRNNIQVIENL